MINSKTFTTLMVLLVVLAAGSAMAGAKLPIGSDGAYIDLGYRLQTYYQMQDMELNGEGDGLDSKSDFSLRRARLRVTGVITDKVSIFLQTDVSGKEVQMIDAFVTYKADPWAQFFMGRNMAPSSRQATTSSGALMAMDRPGLVYNGLNWGTRYKVGFNATTFNGTGINGGSDTVRDNGLTLFGSGELGGNHLKYYVGMYNGGGQAGGNDTDHVAFRAQYNLWDAEGAYYNSSTYLGKKKTLGIGFSYDMQTEVTTSAAPNAGDPDILVDYALMSIDGFLELPSANGNALTVEAAYNMLDFDDAPDFMSNQGSGYYAQVGYYLASGFQPWVLYEAFSTDGAADANGDVFGDFTTIRAGVTYFFDGHRANVKLGFESFKVDQAMMVDGVEEDTINSVTLGFFTTY